MGREATELTWVYPESPVGLMHVVVVIPERRAAEQRLPVLIAMHGRGEALKGPARGARGWVDDYWLPRAKERLRHPPLRSADLLGFSEPTRQQRIKFLVGKFEFLLFNYNLIFDIRFILRDRLHWKKRHKSQ